MWTIVSRNCLEFVCKIQTQEEANRVESNAFNIVIAAAYQLLSGLFVEPIETVTLHALEIYGLVETR